jgi:hypothetical protein
MATNEGKSDGKFNWSDSLRNNYLVIALGLIISGGTGTLAAKASVDELLKRAFSDLVRENRLVTADELAKVEISRDAIGFFMTACPPNWRPFQQATGRYLVVADSTLPGLLGTTVGTALDGAENRPAGAHKHGFMADQHQSQSTGNEVEWMDPGGGHMPTVARETDDGVGLKAGTNAPFILVNACLKD